ncbi:MAG TPA: hypothetical protein VH138_11280 [Vicinamibacterales bacterium]|nr:hypothetical protein [Vicinamibacterales bacterium]
MRSGALVAALAAFLLYMANGREIPSYDSQPAKYPAIEIATRHSLSLSHVVGRVPALGDRPAFVRDRHGNYRSAYPLPSALAAGAVAWTLTKLHVLDPLAPLAAPFVAKLTASALTAITVALAFLAAAQRVTKRQAALIALTLGSGTNRWGSVSQTLWQQETGLCAVMGALLILTRREARVGNVLAAGVLVGLAGWARPQLVPIVGVLALSMIVRWRMRGAIAMIPIACLAALAIAINIAWFGHPLGAVPLLESMHPTLHATSGSISATPWVSAAGLLVSPSRGLLVFSPVLAYCFYQVWWGGHTFGPRYMLDILPPLVPPAAAGFPVIAGRRPVAVLASKCLAWSIGAAALGAFVYPLEFWNLDPNVDAAHWRLWDWRDSQLARAAHAGWNPENFALFSRASFRQDARNP